MANKRKLGASVNVVKPPRQPVNWKQWAKRSSLLLVLLFLVVGSSYLHDDKTLPILHVTVEGKFHHIDKNALVKAVTPYVRGSFVSVDVASIRQAGEALPWVKQIQVRRIWPDTLNLIVEEQKAIAFWNKNGLVNTQGNVFFPPASTFPTGLVQLEGPKDTSVMMTARLVQIQQQVQPLGLQVALLKMDKRRSWELAFSNGLNLKLGRADDDLRLKRFVTVFSGRFQRYQQFISTVDMRYTNGFSVEWKPGEKPDFNGTV